MSKFLLNLLVKISKAMVYSKIKFYLEKNFFPVTSGPAAAHSFFSSQPAAPPLPTRPRPLGRPSHAAFALSSRPADRWTPPIIPHIRPTRARSRRDHLPPLPAPPSPTSDATRAFPTPPSFPPLNLAPTFNGVTAINAAVTPPDHPSLALPRPV
jgi:hypothetical protein